METLLPQVIKLAAHARACGVPTVLQSYKNMPHVFQAFADILPSALPAIDDIGKFIAGVFTEHHGLVKDDHHHYQGSNGKQIDPDNIRRSASSALIGSREDSNGY